MARSRSGTHCGASGAAFVAKAVHELHGSNGELAIITVRCDGGLGVGTLLRRV